MTTSKSETPDNGTQEDPNAELAALTADGDPGGAYDPNTPPPAGAYDPNSPTPQGAYDPNGPTPNGAYDPNTPPAGTGGQSNGTAQFDGATLPPTPPPAPVQPPPQQPRDTGFWVHNHTVTRLWSTSAAPGVWVEFAGLGWKRLASAADGRSSLTVLALLARNHGLAVSFHENAAGQIDQLLV